MNRMGMIAAPVRAPADGAGGAPAGQVSAAKASPSAAADGAAPAPAKAGNRLRNGLMLGGIVGAAVIATLWWLATPTGFITDDAYVRAPKLAVSTDVAGTVLLVAVHEGQAVRAGDVLVELDPLPYRIAVDQARAARDGAVLEAEAMRRDLDRAERDAAAAESAAARTASDNARRAGLVASGGVTRSEADDARFHASEAQATLAARRAAAAVLRARLGGDGNVATADLPNVRSAAARLAEAERQLRRTVLRAPFDAVVTNADSVQPGQYLPASTATLALVGTARVWVEAFPKETDLADSRPGDVAEVVVDTYPGRTIRGHVESISPASASAFSVLPAQNASGNWVKIVQRIPVRIALELDAQTPPLRDGMSVTVRARAARRKTLADLLP